MIKNICSYHGVIADGDYDRGALRAFVDLNDGKSIIPKRNYGGDIVKTQWTGVYISTGIFNNVATVVFLKKSYSKDQ